MKPGIVVLSVMMTVAMFARDASACSCVDAGPACAAYWKVAAVFVGRVESIANVTGKGPGRFLSSRQVRLTVSEAFNGVSGKTIDVTTGSGGGDCGFAFRQGGEYLVYATRDEATGGLLVSVCSRTRDLSQAADDLAYIRAVAAGGTVPGRIFGDVVLATRVIGGGPSREPRPLTGVGIRLDRDGQSVRVATGDDGRFVAEGVGPGRYTASLELPDGLYADGWPQEIELRSASSCAELHATAFADGRVSGRVVDAAGRPVAGLTIELTVPAAIDKPFGAERLRDLTDSEGRFEIVHVPAGRFIVGINTQPAPDGRVVEPRVFHPGVTALQGSTRVALRASERLTLGDFVLPKNVAFVPVTGVVFEGDGSPAVNARVYLKGAENDNFILNEPAVTDAGGRFTLAAVAGREYRLFAERERADAGRSRIDSSEQLPFTAAAGAPPFKLTLRRRY
jgi:5-hydroxyisourate hydrolase-like protein (transthyretin family)